MTYFTSWDINLFLCLLSLGLPRDLVGEWIYRIREIDKYFCLERERSFHADRFIPIVKFRENWGWGGVYGNLLIEYKGKLGDIEPEDRYEYFEWAYENHYYFWNSEMMNWVRGFHPGRFYLMDCKRIREHEIETMEDIRDLENVGAMFEERFIRKQDHIDDILDDKRLYSY